ncbi:hypothetical protein [Priestia megaterium]|uniref:hypothetical protein n=1 Tax=Priestia megaterium TaxID=1404 RepID=UPI00203F270C|nr:hypothetical protein [Priestia megaterium]MCM3099873.1 hypothetical protein [Priestia megaterium]
MSTRDCMVCKEPLKGRRLKKCEDCDPFWDKAKAIIDKPDSRKPVRFHKDQEKNIALFAKEMKDDWDRQAPYYLCKYTWLPMIDKLPIVEKKDDESEEEFKEREEKQKENNKFLEYMKFSPDRIDSDKDYEKDNIRVCSYLGNVMKNALSEETFDSVTTEIIKSRITIGQDKELAKMLLLVLKNFYSKKKFNQEELEKLFEK